MPKYCLGVLVVLLLGMAVSCHAEKWAIVVGINEYQDAGISDLECAVQDAQMIYEVLTEAPEGFASENVILLSDSQTDPLYKPTRSRLFSYLTTWFAEPVVGDTVLFYFAGHGTDSQGRSFLLPSDATLTNPAVTGIPLETVKEYLRQCKATKRVMIVDTCHSGAGRDVDVMGSATAQALFEDAEGLVTLASCKQDERSYEWKEQGHGAFSYFLAEGLGGAADADDDGVVLASELNRYVWHKTRKWAAGRGLQQHPKYVSAVQGDIMLVRVPPRGPQRPPTPQPQPVPSVKPWERPGSRGGEELTGPDGGKFVWVPGGRFRMGSTREDVQYQIKEFGDFGVTASHQADELYAHYVDLDGFWIGKCEVTNAQYATFLNESDNKDMTKWLDMVSPYCEIELASDGYRANPGWEHHPVVGVSWYGAKAYCDHYGLNLPTEAQWEYAARGPESLRYPWGKEWDSNKCCNANNRGEKSRMFAVGSIGDDVSWCGVLDMAGNVSEWTADWYEETYYRRAAPRNPPGPRSGLQKVVRGGTYCNVGSNCNASNRSCREPGFMGFPLGFRVSASCR